MVFATGVPDDVVEPGLARIDRRLAYGEVRIGRPQSMPTAVKA
jgi:hypothetical protein